MDGISPGSLPTVQSLGRYVPRETDERTALRSFEAYMVGEMMRRAAPKESEGVFDGGEAGRMYRDHLYQEYARLIAEQGAFGLAKELEGSLGLAPAPSDEAAPADPRSAIPGAGGDPR